MNLQPFCSESDLRPQLQKPWRRDGFTWATDGRVLVRVPAIDYHAEENEDAPGTGTVGAFDHDSLETEWLSIDVPEPEVQECRKCKGTGRSNKCKSCFGDGRCECDCGNEHDCGECDGTGIEDGADEVCNNCENGKVEIVQQVAIGEAVVNLIYLRKIATLPNPVFARPATWDTPIAFKFDGGVGYLMPMRKDSVNA